MGDVRRYARRFLLPLALLLAAIASWLAADWFADDAPERTATQSLTHNVTIT